MHIIREMAGAGFKCSNSIRAQVSDTRMERLIGGAERTAIPYLTSH